MLLIMFQVWQGIPGINLQVVLASTWEQGLFFVFSHLDYSNSKNIQANPCGFIRDNKKGPLQICQALLKCIKPNSCTIDLKIARPLFSSKMSLFEIQHVFLARHHG